VAVGRASVGTALEAVDWIEVAYVLIAGKLFFNFYPIEIPFDASFVSRWSHQLESAQGMNW
jgi:hypothetical protein